MKTKAAAAAASHKKKMKAKFFLSENAHYILSCPQKFSSKAVQQGHPDAVVYCRSLALVREMVYIRSYVATPTNLTLVPNTKQPRHESKLKRYRSSSVQALGDLQRITIFTCGEADRSSRDELFFFFQEDAKKLQNSPNLSKQTW